MAGENVAADTAVRVSKLLTQSYLEMIEGQCRDLQFEQRATIGAQEYLDMIALKTGALIRSSLVIGATIATDDPEILAGVARFGTAIGRLFQIRDGLPGYLGRRGRNPANPPIATSYNAKRVTRSCTLFNRLKERIETNSCAFTPSGNVGLKPTLTE